MRNDSRALNWLRRLYGIVLRRMSALQAMAEHGLIRPRPAPAAMAEQLEPRLLLSSVSLNVTAGTVTVDITDDDGHTLVFADGGGAHQTHLTVDGGAEVYNFNNPAGQVVINSQAGSDTVTINALDAAFDADIVVTGNSGDDSIIVNAVTGIGTISFDGGTGSDTLGSPALANTWAITAANTGTLNTVITFANVENLVGGGVSENLAFDAGATISGLINGRGGDLTLTSDDTLTIPAGAIVSSRGVGLGANPQTDPSTGDSGSLALTAPHIAIGAGAKLLANADNGFMAGDITLHATDEATLNWALGMVGFKVRTTSASINVGAGAVVEGNDVEIKATSKTDKTVDLQVDLAHDTRQAVVADVNGDTRPDLILGNNGASTQLYLNSGHVNPFDSAPIAIGGADATMAVVVGDVTGDGRPDLILGNNAQASRLYVNSGHANPFDAAPVNIGAGTDATTSLALVDVTGDTKLDLIVGNNAAGQAGRLYVNNGTLTPFADAPQNIGAGTDATTAVAVADLTSDGLPDLVVGNAGAGQASRLYVNNGTATPFSGAAQNIGDGTDVTTSLAIGDVTGDGKADLIIGNNGQPIRLYAGTGTLTPFTGVPLAIGGSDATLTVALADVSGDGKLDLVTGTDGDDDLVYVNTGTATPYGTGIAVLSDRNCTQTVVIADVNNDGHLDLMKGYQLEIPELFLSKGTADPFTGVDGVSITPETELSSTISESKVATFSALASVVLSSATANILIGSGAQIAAAGDVTLISTATSVANNTTESAYLGGTYASSTPTANVTVNGGGTQITAGGLFDMEALANNTLSANVKTLPKSTKGAGVMFAYGKARSSSTALINSGATITADNAKVISRNTNDFTTTAKVGVKGGGGGNTVGLAVTITIGDYQSDSSTLVSGTVTTSAGDITIQSESINNTDKTTGSASIDGKKSKKEGEKPGLVDQMKTKLSNISFVKTLNEKFTNKNKTVNANDGKIGVELSAAVVVVISDNSASAKIGDGAVISAFGKLDLLSKASDNVQVSAQGSAGNADKASVGGAVAISVLTNQGTSEIGAATVDAGGVMDVKSESLFPSQLVKFDDALGITPADSGDNGTARISSDSDDGSSVVDQVKGLVERFKPFVDAITSSGQNLSTTYVQSGATVNPGGKAGIAGGINFVTFGNHATAKIDSGARVNTVGANNATQDVKVEANASIQTVDLAGQAKLSNLTSAGAGGSGGDYGIGGSFSMVMYNNAATAMVDDNATVKAGRDIDIAATTDNYLVSIVQAGGKGEKLGIDGAFTVLVVNNTALAYAEDRATLDAGHDININATDTALVINGTGGIAIGKTAGVGVSASVTLNDDTAKAFIGNYNNGVGAAGTVNADHNMVVEADSTQKIWGISLTGAFSSGGQSTPDQPDGQSGTDNGSSDDPLDGVSLPNLFGEPPQGQPAQPTGGKSGGIGISGDVAVNFLTTDVEAYIQHAGAVTVGGLLDIEASNATPQYISGVGGIAYGNDAGIAGSFAWNSLDKTTRGFIDSPSVTAGNLTLQADSPVLFIAASAGVGASRNKAAVAGSMNLDFNKSDTQAYIASGAVVTASSGANQIAATTEVTTWTIAGVAAVTIQGNAAVGAGLDLGFVNDTTKAYVAGTLNAQGDVSIHAATADHIHSISVCFSASFKGSVGAAGAASSMNVTQDVEAYIGNGATVTTPGSVRVDAYDDTWLLVIAGAAGGGKNAGIGLSVANNNITRTVNAYVGDNATVSAKGAGAGIADPDPNESFGLKGLTVDATTNEWVLTFAAGVAGAQDAAIAASALVNTETSSTKAWIGQSALVNSNNAGANAAQSVMLRALHDSDMVSVVGSFGGAKSVGIGAAADVEVINRTAEAQIAASATVKAAGDVVVSAAAPQNMYSVAGAGAGAGDVDIAGSATILTLTNTVKAHIDSGAVVFATGNVSLSAQKPSTIMAVAGQGGYGGTAGIGASDVTVVTIDNTLTYIAGTASVTALGASGSAINVYTGTQTGLVPDTTAMYGLSLTATSFEDLLTIAAGAQGGGDVGIAGSAVANVETETTRASIEKGAIINGNNAGAGAAQDVYVLASDHTGLISIAGALSGAGTMGLGAGADVGTIIKNTQAYIQATTVNANNNVQVLSHSKESLLSLSASAGIGGDVGLGGSAGVYSTVLTTRAFIGHDSADAAAPVASTVIAQGNVKVAADDATSLNLIAGNIVGAGTVSVGVAAAISVSVKTTEAFLGQLADVRAKAHSAGIAANTGDFNINLVAPSGSEALPTADPSDGSIDTSGINVTPPGAQQVRMAGAPNLNFIVTGSGDSAVYSINRAAGNWKTDGFKAGMMIAVGNAGADNGTYTIQSISGDGKTLTLGSADMLTSRFNVAGATVVSTVSRDAGAQQQFDNPLLSSQRVSTPVVGSVQGVVVTATNQDAINTVAASGGASGTVAVNIGGSVNVMKSTTSAYVASGATVNASNADAGANQSVLVAAGNDYSHVGVTAVAGGSGTVAVTPGVDVTVVLNNTYAYADDGSSVLARGDIAVIAKAKEDALTISAGVAASGMVSVSGSADAMSINDKTYAYIGNDAATDGAAAVAAAGGNILVKSSDDTRTYVVVGSLGLGFGAVGIGGSVGLTVIIKDTQAFVGSHAMLDASANTAALTGIYDGTLSAGNFGTLASFHGVAVQSSSSENVLSIAAAGGGGFYCGLGGGVTVEIVTATTRATVGNAARINTVASAAGGTAASEGVNVSAVDSLDVFALGGGFGGGIAGIGGGVDVGIILNDTSATLNNAAIVNAKGNVDVNSLTSKNAISMALSAAGGIVAVAGSISVWDIGTLHNDTYSTDSTSAHAIDSGSFTGTTNSVDGEAGSFLGGYSSTGKGGAGDNTSYVGQGVGSASAGISANVPTGQVNAAVANTTIPGGTVAAVGNATHVTAGGSVGVRAQDDVNFDVIVGSVSGGGVCLGAAIAVANVMANEHAYIDQNAIVTAGVAGNVAVLAHLDENLLGVSVAGSVSGVASLGAQVAVLNDSSTQRAEIGSAASIPQAGAVSVIASADRTGDAISVGAGVSTGGVAAGASVAVTALGGASVANVGSALIGQTAGKNVGSLLVKADNESTADGDAVGVMAGLFGGLTGVFTYTHANPTITADIAANARVKTTGDVSVMGESQGAAEADAIGVSVSGGASLGASIAWANVNPTVTSYVGSGAVINAGGNVRVSALHNVNELGVGLGNLDYAYAVNGAGGLFVGVSGSDAETNASSTLDSYVTGATITAAGNATVSALADNDGKAYAFGLGIGMVGVGASLANVTINGSTKARMESPTVAAGSLNVTADTIDTADADTKSGAGGIVAGSGSIATARANSTTEAHVASAAGIAAVGDVAVSATAHPQASADASGAAGGLAAVGVSQATAEDSPTVTAYLAGGAVTAAGVTVNGAPVLTFTPNTGRLTGNPSLQFIHNAGSLTGNPSLTFAPALGVMTNAPTLNFVNSPGQLTNASLTFVNGADMSGTPTLAFTHKADNSGDTIVRDDGVNWADDGFAPGQEIVIAGAGADSGTWHVLGVAGTTLTLVTTESVTDQAAVVGASISGRSAISRAASWITSGFAVGQTIQVAGSATNNGLYQIASISADGKTVNLLEGQAVQGGAEAALTVSGLSSIRRDGGSWGTDGFVAGGPIEISGSASNDGIYQVASISSDGNVLYLAHGQAVTAESTANAAVAGRASITRAAGSWTADHFSSGQLFSLSGTTQNDGLYYVDWISPDAKTLTLPDGTTLFGNTDSGVAMNGVDEILRGSGTWAVDGFDLGQPVQIAGTVNNNGIYHVSTLMGSLMILQGGEDVVNETKLGATATALSTITRSAGNWSTDGFAPGQTVAATGTEGNNGTYHIAAISGGGSVIELAPGELVADESAASGSLATVSNVSVVAMQALPAAGPSAHADATASTGGLVGINATSSSATGNGHVTSYIGGNTTVSASGNVTVDATTYTQQRGSVEGYQGGLLAVGANYSYANSSTLTNAYLGGNIALTSGGLNLYAGGVDDNLATADSGSGGVISGTASEATTNNTSQSKAYISDSAPGKVISAGRVNITAEHTAVFNGRANSVNASFAGGSGAYSTNHDHATVQANIGSSVDIQTRDLVITALNHTRKNWLGDYNITSGSGGVLDLPATKSVTDITNTTSVTVGTGSTMYVNGDRDNPGQFKISAVNDVIAYDRGKLDAGGAIEIASADSEITNVDSASVNVGSGDDLRSVGTMNFGAQTLADVQTQANAKTYGLAGAASGYTKSAVNGSDLVHIGPSAYLRSGGDMNLYAGRNADGQANNINATAHTDLWNKTVFPISTDPGADAIVTQNNAVTIDSGAWVGSVQNANLAADAGVVSALGQGIGKDLYREALAAIGSAISHLFGGGDVSLDITGGSTSVTGSGVVAVNGTTAVGIQNHQYLTFAKDGSVITPGPSDGVTYLPAHTESLSNDIQAQIDRLGQMKTAFTGLPDVVAAYAAEISQLQSQLADLGGSNVDVGFIDVGDLYAQAGDINVTGGALVGSGHLQAPGDVLIQVINNSPNFLRLHKLTIPEGQGGHITFNTAPVTSNTATNPPTVGHGFAEILSATNSPKPEIFLQNTYAPGEAGNPDGLAPDIYLVGEVENLGGSVVIRNTKGSIRSSTRISADTLDFLAPNGDFVQSYQPGIFGVGGEAKTRWTAVAAITESAKVDYPGSGFDQIYWNIPWAHAAITTAISNVDNTHTPMVLGNNVFISAQYLNINSTVQSGIDNYSLTLPASLIATINADRSNYQSLLAQGISADPYYTLTGSNNTVTAYFNASLNQIELGNINVRGGHMELFGQILSTGDGNLAVRDGFGRINVDNQTGLPMVTATLNAGNGAGGYLKITDTASHVTSLGTITTLASADHSKDIRPLTTVMQRLAGAVKVTDNLTLDANGAPSHVVTGGSPTNPTTVIDSRHLTYQPLAGQYYSWLRASETWTSQQKTVDKKHSWFGLSSHSSTSTSVTNTSTVGPVSVRDATVLFDPSHSEAYWFVHTNEHTDGNWAFQSYEDHVTLGWGHEYWYYTRTNYDKDYYQQDVKAFYPISIQFIGSDTGSIDINSPAGLTINGSITNAGGEVTLSAGSGAIESSAAATITAASVTLTAGTGIGAASLIRTDLAASGWINAATTTGDVNIQELAGKMTVKQAVTGGGNVSLASENSIQAFDNTALVRGGLITLASQNGGIGDTGALPIRAGSTDPAMQGVNAAANGDINLRQTAGDLLAIRIVSSAGDVTIRTDAGNLLDNNTLEHRDTRTAAELLSLWNQMELTGAGAQASADATVAAFEQSKDAQYGQYWNYRQQQPDGGAMYDPAFQVPMSQQEEDYYLGLGWTQARIDQLKAQRTSEYHSLNAVYGPYGDSYDPAWRYHATAAEKAQLTTGAEWTTDELQNSVGVGILGTSQKSTTIEDDNIRGNKITLDVNGGGIGQDAPDLVIDLTVAQQSFDPSLAVSGNTIRFASAHSFTTGEKVIYSSGSDSDSAIGGLVSGGVYYVVRISATSIELAATQADAENAVPVVIALDSGAATGSAHNIRATVQLSDEEKLALAAAEPSDLTVDAVHNALTVSQHKDLNLTVVDSAQALNAAADGLIYIGSEGRLNLDRIRSRNGQSIRLMGKAGVFNFASNAALANIAGGSAIIEADNAGIGNDGATIKPITVDLSAAATLTASAYQDIYIAQLAGNANNLNIDLVLTDSKSNGLANVTANGSILNAASLAGQSNFMVASLKLTAAGSVGSGGTPIRTQLRSATTNLDITAGQSVYVDETRADIVLGQVIASNGDVSLRALGSIYDGTGHARINVIGNNITLTSQAGNIGNFAQEVQIDSASAAAGMLTASAFNNAYIIEALGDMSLNRVTTTTGRANLMAQGWILNGTGGVNLVVGEALLQAGAGAGDAGHPLLLQGDGLVLAGLGGTGGIFIVGNGNLVIDTVDGISGLSSAGPITISADCAITITQDITSDGDITITADDTAAAGDDLLVTHNATVESTGGSVTLRAGDNLRIDAGSTVRSSATNPAAMVEISGDYANADALGGTIIDLWGQIFGAQIDVYGGGFADSVNVTNVTAGSAMNIYAGAGDDTVNVGSNAAAGSNTGGDLQAILGQLSISGQGGGDVLNVDDTGDATGRDALLTSVRLTGLGMGETGIAYDSFENMNIGLGEGGDQFVSLDNGAVTVITSGSGDDEFRIGPLLSEDGIPQPTMVDGVLTAGKDVPGTSFEMTINGGDGDDYFIVNRNLAVLNLNGQAGDDTFEINTAVDSLTSNVVGGGGADIIGFLLNAPVNINGGDGFDRIIVNGSFLSEHFIITADSVRIIGSRVIHFGGIELVTVNGKKGNDLFDIDTTIDDSGDPVASSVLRELDIFGGLGNDTINIYGLLPGIQTFVYGNEGDDTINVGSLDGNVQDIQGELTIDGGSNADASSGSDTLNVIDTGDTTGRSGVLTAASITGLGMGETGIGYAGFETLNVNLGQGEDTFDVASSSPLTITNVYGGPGDDRLIIRDAQFIRGVFDGGAGINTIDYSDWTTSVTADLMTGRGTGTYDGFDTGLRNVQNATGGSGSDFLIGDDGDNVLTGNAGDDYIYGNGGNDTLVGGTGNNRLAGGTGDDTYILAAAGNDTVIDTSGSDTLDFSTAAQGVTVDMSQSAGQTQTITADGHTLSLTGTPKTLIGTQLGDTLTGNDAGDTIYGLGGDDVIRGGSAADNLYGGDGNDSLYGMGGDDHLYGGAGDDLLDGGSGFNYADYSDAPDAVQADLSGLRTDTAADLNPTDHGIGQDTLANIQGLIGSDFNDVLIGGARPDILQGGRGDDTITGGSGGDTILWFSGDGSDTVTGNNNRLDVVRVTLTDADDTLELATVGDAAVVRPAGGAAMVTMTGIQTVEVNTAGGDDGVTVGPLATTGVQLVTLDLGAGDDAVIGDLGNGTHADTPIHALGGAGDDTFIGGSAADVFDGGDGTNTVDYSQAPAGIDITLDGASRNDGYGSADRLTGIENLIGSPFADKIHGSKAANAIYGGDGNDEIWGNGGSDVIYGQAGDDILHAGKGSAKLYGGAGNNTLYGGGGTTMYDGPDTNSFFGGPTDWIDYSDAPAGVTVRLDLGTATDGLGHTDLIKGVENVIGSDFDDTLIGDKKGNHLVGGAGDDTIQGGGGNDILEGGAGRDILDGGLGNNTLIWNAGDGDDQSADGGLGKNTLRLIGGDGSDDFSLAASGALLQLTLNGLPSFTAAHMTTVLVNAGSGDDSVALGDLTAVGLKKLTIDLGAGDDAFDASTAKTAFTVLGGAGDDAMSGNPGKGTFDGGIGNNTIDYSLASRGIIATMNSSVTDSVVKTRRDRLRNFTIIIGTDFADIITGGVGNETLIGGDGNDTLTARGGNDRLVGGLGDDTLVNRGAKVAYADYSASAVAMDVNLRTGKALAIGGADATQGTDTLVGINGVIGTDFADLITGNDKGNTLMGMGGDDVINAGSGDDTITGGSGDDTVNAGPGSDTIIWNAGDGSDTIDAGVGPIFGKGPRAVDRGQDVLIVNGRMAAADNLSVAADSGQAGVVLLVDSTMPSDGGTTIASSGIRGIEEVRLATGGGDDLVTVGDLAGTGVTAIQADLGDGDDTFDGSATAVKSTVSGGAGNDTITTGSGNDTLVGGPGDDVLCGGAGNDLLQGGAGSDRYIMSTGQDTIGDSEGVADRLDFSRFDHGVDVDLQAALGRMWALDTQGNAFHLTGRMRIVIGSGYDDTISGNDLVTSIDPTTGTLIVVWDGKDTLIGGGGNDTIDGRTGDDILIGGFAQVRNDGSLLLDDGIGGDDGNDTLIGGSGNNTLIGGSGNDTLTGGDGNDTLLCGYARIDVHGLFQGLDLHDHADGNDRLSGGAGDNRLLGGSGDDELIGSGGNDWLDGGTGNDHLSGVGMLLGWCGNDVLDDTAAAANRLSVRLYGQEGDDTAHADVVKDFVDLGPGANQTLPALTLGKGR